MFASFVLVLLHPYSSSFRQLNLASPRIHAPPSPSRLFTVEISWFVSNRLFVEFPLTFFGPTPCRQPSPADPPRSRQTFRCRATAKRRRRGSSSASLRPDDLSSVVSHRSILFRKTGGKNLKIPPPWEINFPEAEDDADCRRRPTILGASWGRH